MDNNTCVSRDRACCRSCAHPVPVEEAILLLDLINNLRFLLKWFKKQNGPRLASPRHHVT
jgi:hypothetical protein